MQFIGDVTQSDGYRDKIFDMLESVPYAQQRCADANDPVNASANA